MKSDLEQKRKVERMLAKIRTENAARKTNSKHSTKPRRRERPLRLFGARPAPSPSSPSPRRRLTSGRWPDETCTPRQFTLFRELEAIAPRAGSSTTCSAMATEARCTGNRAMANLSWRKIWACTSRPDCSGMVARSGGVRLCLLRSNARRLSRDGPSPFANRPD